MTCPPPNPLFNHFLVFTQNVSFLLLIIDWADLFFYHYFGLCLGWMPPLYNYPWFISYSWGLIWRLLTTPAIASTLYRTQPFFQMVINDDLLALTCNELDFFIFIFLKFYCSLLYYSFYRAVHAIFVWTHAHTQKKTERNIIATTNKNKTNRLGNKLDFGDTSSL